jgi:hypothetical protein
MTHEHHLHGRLLARSAFEPEATSGSLMAQCSRHVIPPAIQADLTNWQAHDLGLGLDALRTGVLTCQRLGTSLTHTTAEVVDPH